MKMLTAFVILAIAGTTTAMAGEPILFDQWGVVRADDGSSVAAVTAVNDDAAFGEWCFFSSKSCTWELLINISCKEGDSALLLANSTSSYSSLKAQCLGKSGQGALYSYAFNWRDLEALIKSPSNDSLVAFAMPLEKSEFRVVRFSLDGLRESTGMVEHRFFKGAQPASMNDQTL